MAEEPLAPPLKFVVAVDILMRLLVTNLSDQGMICSIMQFSKFDPVKQERRQAPQKFGKISIL